MSMLDTVSEPSDDGGSFSSRKIASATDVPDAPSSFSRNFVVIATLAPTMLMTSMRSSCTAVYADSAAM